MRQRSKIDLWVRIVLWAAVLLIIVSLILIPADERVIGFAIGIPASGIILWIYFGTYFELREHCLYCRCGPFFEKIAYEKIKSLKPCRNMLSSMALSRDRIEICQHDKSYITGTTYISPRNQQLFLEELFERCKNLDSKQ